MCIILSNIIFLIGSKVPTDTAHTRPPRAEDSDKTPRWSVPLFRACVIMRTCVRVQARRRARLQQKGGRQCQPSMPAHLDGTHPALQDVCSCRVMLPVPAMIVYTVLAR